MSASQLQTLPVEILQPIVSHSTSDTSLKVMRTCKTLAARIEPLMYESIEWNIEKTYHKATLNQFLHKLARRPEVGLWVRHFTMKGRYPQHVYSGMSRFDIEQIIQRAEKRHPSVFEVEKTTEWWNMMHSNSSVVLVALLVLSCPNIQHITPWTGYHEADAKLVFLQKALSTLPNLKSLDWGTGHSDLPKIPWRSALMEDVFRLPSLKSLRIQVIDDIPATESALPQAPQIQSLELHNSLIREESISTILSNLPNLTSLHLRLWRETQTSWINSTVIGPWIRCKELFDALRVVGKKIEHLTISTEYRISKAYHKDAGGPFAEYGSGPRQTWGTVGYLNQLREFEHLQSLEIDPVLLFGWDAEHSLPLKELVPSSLKRLKFRTDFGSCKRFKAKLPFLKDAMQEFIAGERETTELRELTIVMFHSELTKYKEAREELVEICQKARLKLRIETCDEVLVSPSQLYEEYMDAAIPFA